MVGWGLGEEKLMLGIGRQAAGSRRNRNRGRSCWPVRRRGREDGFGVGLVGRGGGAVRQVHEEGGGGDGGTADAGKMHGWVGDNQIEIDRQDGGGGILKNRNWSSVIWHVLVCM